MKCYFDTGLKELAQCSGYPVAAIQSCSQFKRTHHFLTEVWEALYRVILDKFLEDTTCSNDSPNNPLSRDAITGLVLSAIEKLSTATDPSPLSKLITTLHEALTDSDLHSHLSSFKDHMAILGPICFQGCTGICCPFSLITQWKLGPTYVCYQDDGSCIFCF